MIEISDLTEKDKGRWVDYVPGQGRTERGKLKFWNNQFIFVVFHCAGKWKDYGNFTAEACKPEDVEFVFKGGVK